jgi:hypothetical protein
MKNTMSDINRTAADVVRALELIGPEGGQELCTMLRRLISGLSPEQADKALIGFFHEIEVCHEVILESCGLRKLADDDSHECPF